MSNTITSPNMSLPIPVPGVDPGPDYANNLNASLAIVDSHNHSSGSGVQITPSGLNISADLAFNSNNLTLARSIRFSPQSSTLSLSTDLGCLYEVGADLYYNDGAGNKIRITQSGSVTGASGTITGLPTGTASVAYSSGTFVFQSATNTSAVMDAGSIILRNNTASSKGLTLAPPNSMGSNYSVTLPNIPAQTSYLTMNTSGTITASVGVPSTPAVSSSSGTSTVGSGGFVTVLSVTLTTYGNPVYVALQSDGSGNNSLLNSSGATSPGYARILRDGTEISRIEFAGSYVSPGVVHFLDVGASAGSHTYALQGNAFSSLAFNYSVLVAYEL